MKSIGNSPRKGARWIDPFFKQALRIVLFALGAVLFTVAGNIRAQQRVLGIDVSAWQGNLSTANWATLHRPTTQQVSGVYGDGRDFVFMRSSRGGTTGYYNQNDASNKNGQNTLSQRYDDPYFVQNITRATSAGLLAGPYHFARPDIIETTLNSGGIANSGTDEANHMIQMAGAWMRPGYLLPVLDLEAGQSDRSSAELTSFCIEFSDRIYAVMGIRPIIYINGSYANYVQSSMVSVFPDVWTARYPNQSDPDSIPVQTGHPKDSYSPIYGPWDDFPNSANPWAFWQYASTARLNGYRSGGASIDVDVAQGGIEFVKDYLVPALWMNDSSGQWTTLLNWNSGQTPTAPVQGPGQVARVGTLTLPTVRLPGANDTVVLDRPGADITVTLSSGTQNIRKLYALEQLDITGGTLNINYVPSSDSSPISAQFSAPVALGGNGTLKADTLQVDAGSTLTINGGTLSFKTVNLMPGNTPARLVMNGTGTFQAIDGSASIARGSGYGPPSFLDLNAGTREIEILSGSEITISVPVLNGGLLKSGAGSLVLTTGNTYVDGTTVSAGALIVNNTTGSGTGSGAVIVNGGMLRGYGTISGPVTINAGGTVAPGDDSSIGKLTFATAPSFGGTNLMRIDRNNGSPSADQIALSNGTLNFEGSLVVSNTGAALVGGEIFKLFLASAYSGEFDSMTLPTLDEGMNWYTDSLLADGTIQVNRSPVANPLTITNVAPLVLHIPISELTSNATDADGDTITLAGFSATTTNGIALLTNNTFISYSNYANVPDEFTYTISDGRGGTASASVQIAPSPMGWFTILPVITTNSVGLHFAGKPGSTYYLERSTNLSDWVTIWTNIAPADGMFDYMDDFHGLTNPVPAAFYRLRWQSAP